MYYYPYKFVSKDDASVVKYGQCHTFGGTVFGFVLDDNEQVEVRRVGAEAGPHTQIECDAYNIEFIGDRPDELKVQDDLNPRTRAVDPLA